MKPLGHRTIASSAWMWSSPWSLKSQVDRWNPVDVYWSLCLTWAIPCFYLVLAFIRHVVAGTGFVKSIVVWGNLFIPSLVGAVANLVPCFATQKSGSRTLMYEAPLQTPCASSLAEAAKLPRLWVGAGTGAVLLFVGPLLWLYLLVGKQQHDKETVGFLTTGYYGGEKSWS